ncbi:MAG: DUF11 domain-containing protein, partial [Deltaproteobacteria bacterium]|nr:DUF11 domain-containing protein [Deltaproteobacteria bacterium]
MKKGIFSLLAVLIIVGAGPAESAVILDSGYITAVEGFAYRGKVYDVEFEYGTFDDVFGSEDPEFWHLSIPAIQMDVGLALSQIFNDAGYAGTIIKAGSTASSMFYVPIREGSNSTLYNTEAFYNDPGQWEHKLTGVNYGKGSILGIFAVFTETCPDNPSDSVSITKTLKSAIPQDQGDYVTWTLTVTNTGDYTINNVEVTDILGDGLIYSSSSESGMNMGQETVWTSAEYPALYSIDPGDNLTMNITAMVDSCDGDDVSNSADVRFGLNASPADTCLDTAVDGGTAIDNGPYTINPVFDEDSDGVPDCYDNCPTPLAISDETELTDCIAWANAKPGADTLGLDADVTLTEELPSIDTEITLNGGGFYVDGAAIPSVRDKIFVVSDDSGNFTVNSITIQNGRGGGIYNGGTLTVANSTFANNLAWSGGGIKNSGIATVTNTTFTGNNASRSFGGGISNDGTLTVTNSTFTGNTSAPGDDDSAGGGIFSWSGTVILTHNTFYDNSALSEYGVTGAGGIDIAGGTAYLAGNIFDGGPTGAQQCSGTITDNGYNLSSDDSCGFDESGADGSADNTSLNLGALS